MLFEEGDPARTLYLLLRGKVLVKVEIASRAEQVCIAVLTHPGQVIGWSALLPDNHYTATVTCSEDTRLAGFDRESCMRALEADPVTGFAVMKHISEVISGRLRNIQRLVLKHCRTGWTFSHSDFRFFGQPPTAPGSLNSLTPFLQQFHPNFIEIE
jgi:CRP-like cAMP-binding protein